MQRMSSRVRSILCAFVSALIASSCTQKQTAPDTSETCMLDGRLQARCRTALDIRVAVLEATVARDREPVLFIPGGPGQSAFEALPQVAAAFGELRKHHDIVTFERSLPRCPVSVSADAADDVVIANARACANEVGDAAHLATTSQYVTDALNVMPERFAIYGASYGTRVALEIMRTHPERLTAVVLDGVIAPESVLGIDQLPFAEAALNALAVDPRPLRDKLPVDVVAREPRSGELTHVWLTPRVFEETIRSALYSRELVALVPRLIRESDMQGIAALTLRQRDALERTINPFIYYSVVCLEDIPYTGETHGAGFFEAHLDVLKSICGCWPGARAQRRTAVTSDVRTLLISGEHDPVTPPSEAARVAKTLEHATLITLKDEGHINVYRGCVPRLLADFVDANAPLDTSCVERAAAFPLFDGMNGP